jgi:hypothetical protein
MGHRKQFAQGKGKQCGDATLSGPASQDYGEQIPKCMRWQTIHNSTAAATAKSSSVVILISSNGLATMEENKEKEKEEDEDEKEEKGHPPPAFPSSLS